MPGRQTSRSPDPIRDKSVARARGWLEWSKSSSQSRLPGGTPGQIRLRLDTRCSGGRTWRDNFRGWIPTSTRFSTAAIVARGARLPLAELYRWTVRDPLPRLPIPLREPDADILIDFAVFVDRVYGLGRYARTLRHDAPLGETTSLSPEDRAWVESQCSDSKHRNG